MAGSWTHAFEKAANIWWQWMAPMAWQAALLVLLLALVTYCLRRRSARTRYALWMLLPARLVLPPTLALVTGWGWWMLPASEPPEAVVAETVQQSTPMETERVERLVEHDSTNFDAANPPEPGTWADFAHKRHQAEAEKAEDAPQRPASAPAMSISWRGWLFLAWIAGVSFFAAQLAVGAARARKLVRQAVPVSDPAVLALAETCRQRIGLRKKIELRTLADSDVPMLLGILKPVILLPESIAERLTADELEAVLTHELVHVARRDALVNLLQSLLGVAYFFHPFVLFGSRMISRLREDACDEATVAVLGGERRGYGSGIVKVAEMIARPAPTMALGVVESKTHVGRRLARILDPRLPLGRRLSWPAALAVLLLAAVLLPSGGRPRAAEEETQSDKTDTNEPAVPLVASRTNAIDEKPAAAKSINPLAVNRLLEPTTVRGTVVDANGAPVRGTRVYLDVSAKPPIDAVTGEKGEFELKWPWSGFRGHYLRVETDGGKIQGTYAFGYYDQTALIENAKITLAPARQVEIDVVDAVDGPISGATVAVQAGNLTLPLDPTDSAGRAATYIPRDLRVNYVFAFKGGKGFDYRAFMHPLQPGVKPEGNPPEMPDAPLKLTLTGAQTVQVRTVDGNDQPLAGVIIAPAAMMKSDQPTPISLSSLQGVASITTDAAGVANFDWLPDWPNNELWFFATKDLHSVGIGTYQAKFSNGSVDVKLHRLVPVRGKVTHADGTPAEGIWIVSRSEGAPGSFGLPVETVTDANGEYEILVAPNHVQLLVVDDKKWGAPEQGGFFVWPNRPKENIDFVLQPATRVFGKVKTGPDNRPLIGRQIDLSLSQQDFEMSDIIGGLTGIYPNPDFTRTTITDASGGYEFFVGPGFYTLRESGHAEVQGFKINGERDKEVLLKEPEARVAKSEGAAAIDRQPTQLGANKPENRFAD